MPTREDTARRRHGEQERDQRARGAAGRASAVERARVCVARSRPAARRARSAGVAADAPAREQRNQRQRQHQRDAAPRPRASATARGRTGRRRPTAGRAARTRRPSSASSRRPARSARAIARPRPAPPILPATRRWMFSTTTTASSMTRPMATARPPIDIRLIVSPNRRMTTNVVITVSGSVIAATSVSRQSRRNRSRTMTASTPPMRIASRTLAIDARTNSARS